jgi:uncharacterized protein (TIGR02444 family)
MSAVNTSPAKRTLTKPSNAHSAPAAPGSRKANPFWRWSLRVYRAPGVQEACLALQDRCGADVNLLLFCGWVGLAGRALDQRRLRQATACVGRWQAEVVAPLRAVRRALKHGASTGSTAAPALMLRRRVAALELEAESVEQTLLFELAVGWPPPARPKQPPTAVAASLGRYLAALPGVPGAAPPPDPRHLARLVDACCATPAPRPGAGDTGAGINKRPPPGPR